MHIGIIGFGFVGQALYSGIKSGETVSIYDPEKGYNNNILETDVVFICVSTPTKKGKQDTNNIDNVFKKLRGYKGVIVLKSTVHPKHINNKDIVVNPEFLNQNTAVEDFKKQNLLILGGKIDKSRFVYSVYRDCFDIMIKQVKYCSIKEACYAKYIHNIYHAYKVLFWDYVQTITGNERFYADIYKRLVPERNEMDRIYADGKRGFGGACFPKDLVAMHDVMPNELTKYMIDYNKMMRSDEMGVVL